MVRQVVGLLVVFCQFIVSLGVLLVSGMWKSIRTRKAALYGSPIGRLAKMASNRLAKADRNARLCEISWMARNRFWLQVAPITYAVTKNRQSSIEVLRRR